MKTRIDDFLAGRMSEAERAAFLKEMESDKSLEEELTLTYLEKEMASLMAEDKINAYVQSLHKDNRPGKVDANTRRPLWMFGLGVLVLAAIALWFIYPVNTGEQVKTPTNAQDSISSQGGQPVAQVSDSSTGKTNDTFTGQSPKDVTPSKDLASSKAKENLALALEYSENFHPELELLGQAKITRGNKPLANAIDSLIKNEQYSKAASLLEKVKPEDANYLPDRYRLGLCHFINKDYRKAIAVFEPLKANADNENHYQTEYLLLLSYLAENRIKEFLELGNTIANPANSSDYQLVTQGLLSDWRKINK